MGFEVAGTRRGRADDIMSKYPQGKYDRHPLNAPGPFYVEDGQCIGCLNTCQQAPELMAFFQAPPDLRGGDHCYVQRQPQNEVELEQMVQAILASCCSGLRYCGDDPVMLARLQQEGYASRCDELSSSSRTPAS